MNHLKFLLVSLCFISSLSAIAAEPTSTTQVSPETKARIESSDKTTGTAFDVGSLSNDLNGYTCTAWTQCVSGRVISCEATGYTCRSSALPGSWVSCEAWGTTGSYSSAYDTCY